MSYKPPTQLEVDSWEIHRNFAPCGTPAETGPAYETAKLFVRGPSGTVYMLDCPLGLAKELHDAAAAPDPKRLTSWERL